MSKKFGIDSAPLQPYPSSQDLGRQKKSTRWAFYLSSYKTRSDPQDIAGNYKLFKYFFVILEILGFKAPPLYGGGRRGLMKGDTNSNDDKDGDDEDDDEVNSYIQRLKQ